VSRPRPWPKRETPVAQITAAWEQRTLTDVRLDAADEGWPVNAFGFPEPR
jgi:hypothetical protein